ncbi:hypothetical protein LTS16_002800 [Friedmanniomyces endolithicus]|nr:hypothetical protein LTR59_011604 [Friedmanniomyces endolithicus]KAK0837970.1 hypothetical protein LTR03_012367 [Friedmanniomyces endolithicus]KAK1050811.1 hypothetical protein LTS16_002800 [Friedmanniomyces endolithicus]
MYNPFDRSAKMAPSHYPRLVFHGLRTFQLVSSVIVGGIMSFFIWHLTHDHWSTPWTFIWLTSASLFSIAALFFTIILHCFIGLNPRLNIALNGFLAVLWTLSWSLLTYYMSGTLANVCDKAHWHEDTGIMVCRIYKALFTFTLLGFVSTLAALGLDIYVRRQQTRRGVYRLHDLDTKARPEATRGPFTDEVEAHQNGDGYAHGGLQQDDSRESLAWEEPRPSIGPYAEQGDKPRMQAGGYAVPEAQFEYDTQYRGGHEERAMR